MKKIIEIENLSFEYDSEGHTAERKALTNVSMSVEAGTFLCIIGKNGSGKSTLAKCMNGLLLPTEGSVKVHGLSTREEEHIWEIREKVGMVFQNPDNQLISSVVEDDVAFGPENMGMPSELIRERVDQALKTVDMWELKDKAPHLLSGGQKQRVAIAGAIAMKPECIVFDEPTAMLDPIGRKEILDTIKNLNGEGITTILITHFMEEAAEADRVILMKYGEIIKDGTPKEIFESEAIKNEGFELPMAYRIAEFLRERGVAVDDDIVTEDMLVRFLCR